MIYAGIDPGQKGAIAVLSSANGRISVSEVWPMPDNDRKLRSIFNYLKTIGATVLIEKAQCMPKQSAPSGFNYGVGYGKMLGLMIAFEIPYHEVRPAIWKKEILAGEPDKKDKKVSIRVCERMFPNVNLLPTERSKVPSDGIAEAVLIADYARRKNL